MATPANPPRRWLLLVVCSTLFTSSAVSASDWIHWRGPNQNGVSPTRGLPESFGVESPGKENLIWKAPIGGRSSPLVLGDRLFLITSAGEGITEGEQVVCLDANTGKSIWEYRFNVFHTDIVSSRLGWTTLTADPETGYVYCHGTQGHLFCFDRDGKVVWQRQLTEEFGRISGYGGRIVSPIFDSGLVIVGMVNGSWGDQARGNNRFVAYDGKTGEVVWWSSPAEELIQGRPSYRLIGTYYSNPVVAVIDGQRLLITGGADGYAHAFKVRSGERVWSYRFSAGVVNPSPVVDSNLVYFAHGEENPEGGPLGRLICLDASQVKNKVPKLVWEYRRANRFGLSSPAIADGILYIPDDSSELFAFDAKKGGNRPLWRYKYGTTARGAPLIADGKLYVFDVFSKLTVLKLNGKDEPEELEVVRFRSPGGSTLVETNGTPIAVNGRLYFMTRDATYCVGDPNAKSTDAPPKKEPAEAPAGEPVAIRIFPADVVAKPGGTVNLAVKFLDANGREVAAVPDAKIEWSLPAPPVPMGAASGPPGLKGEVKSDGLTATVAVDRMPSQQGLVLAKAGKLTARARLRVAPQLPYTNDFERLPAGGSPAGWINANGKFVVKEVDGKKVLSKVNTNPAPPVARANGYITLPSARDYVIQCDIMATEVRGKLPDAGVVNCRYTLILDGKKDPDTGKRSARLVSWEANPPSGRVNVGADFDWQPNTWYTLKVTIEQKEKTAVVRAKVWKTGEAEPSAWTIEYEDPLPNREGAAAIYGYVSNITDTDPGSDIYYDNLSVAAAGSKP